MNQRILSVILASIALLVIFALATANTPDPELCRACEAKCAPHLPSFASYRKGAECICDLRWERR